MRREPSASASASLSTAPWRSLLNRRTRSSGWGQHLQKARLRPEPVLADATHPPAELQAVLVPLLAPDRRLMSSVISGELEADRRPAVLTIVARLRRSREGRFETPASRSARTLRSGAPLRQELPARSRRPGTAGQWDPRASCVGARRPPRRHSGAECCGFPGRRSHKSFRRRNGAATTLVTVAGRMHDDEVDVNDALVRRLLAAQMPHLADRRISLVEPWGTDNGIWRLGGDLVV